MKELLKREKALIACVLLTAATALVYRQVSEFDFIHFDDDGYVRFNQNVQKGLTTRSICWALRTTDETNWHPLTWLSLMLDYQIAGLSPGQFHITNVLLHITATLLLFLLLERMTGRTWPSAFAAGLFALHPLHVQSVAWISERKDVLSTVFWMLTIWTYLNYLERPRPLRMLLAILIFALGLMAKPMLVTLPFVLMLIDWWPLRRFGAAPDDQRHWILIDERKMGSFRTALREKMPLFVLAGTSATVTFIVQREGGAVGGFREFPLDIRMAGAAIAIIHYLVKMVWPSKLALLYLHPGAAVPFWQTMGSLAAIAAVSIVAVKQRHRRPYLIVGWLWYLITLLPVMGLVQIGDHLVADRYTYVPLIGIFIALTWTAADFSRRLARVSSWNDRPYSDRAAAGLRIATALAAAGVLIILAAASHREIGYWRDGTTLFSRAVEIEPGNYIMRNSLGCELVDDGRFEEAKEQFELAISTKSDYEPAHQNLGTILLRIGDIEQAIRHLERAAELDPSDFSAKANLGQALLLKGDAGSAAAIFREALKLRPGDPDIEARLAEALELLGEQEHEVKKGEGRRESRQPSRLSR